MMKIFGKLTEFAFVSTRLYHLSLCVTNQRFLYCTFALVIAFKVNIAGFKSRYRCITPVTFSATLILDIFVHMKCVYVWFINTLYGYCGILHLGVLYRKRFWDYLNCIKSLQMFNDWFTFTFLFSGLTANGSLFTSSAVSDKSLSHYHLKYTDTK